METDSLPVALHVSALQVARAEGDLAGVAGEGVGRTRSHASHVEVCRSEWYTASLLGKNVRRIRAQRDKKCLEGQTFACHVPNFVSETPQSPSVPALFLPHRQACLDLYSSSTIFSLEYDLQLLIGPYLLGLCESLVPRSFFQSSRLRRPHLGLHRQSSNEYSLSCVVSCRSQVVRIAFCF